MHALISQRDLYDGPLRRLIAQVEPLLARHFPEFETFFDLSRRKTPYVLLQAFSAPADLAACPVEQVQALLAKASRRAVDAEHAHRLHEAARNTSGVPMIDEEKRLIQHMSAEILRLFVQRHEVDERIADVAQDDPVVQALRPTLGVVTSAVVVAHLGSPADYRCAAAFEKAAGLNLREHSSGTRQGGRHISKRGPGRVRKYLFLAAMRLVQDNPHVRAWYQRRSAFGENQKAKALIAVTRKLCRALVHLARGNPFDVEKLFDLRRLSLAATNPSNPTTEVTLS
jgi:hypothetical protein